MPKGATRLDSFEDWSEIVGNVVMAADIADPCGRRENMRGGNDALRALVAAVGIGHKQVVLAVDVPDVATAGALGDRRRLGAVVVRGGVDDLAITLKEVAARRATAGADLLQRTRGEVEHEDLVRRHLRAAPLQDQPAAVVGPVGFGVLAVEGQLAHIAKVRFAVEVGHGLASAHDQLSPRNGWVERRCCGGTGSDQEQETRGESAHAAMEASRPHADNGPLGRVRHASVMPPFTTWSHQRGQWCPSRRR